MLLVLGIGMTKMLHSAACVPQEIQHSERLVANRESAILGSNNLFDVDNQDGLIFLSSGTVATDEVVRDVLHAEEMGSQVKAQFITSLESGADILTYQMAQS